MPFTNIASLNTARDGNRNAGNSNAGITIAGEDSNENYLINTEEYNGTSWSYSGNLNTARWVLSSQGSQTAALCEAGEDTSFSALSSSEEYDGTSWSYGGNLNTAREDAVGTGTQSAGLISGGDDLLEGETILASSEEYNGTSWSYGGNLNTSREQSGGAGTQNNSLIATGWDDLGNFLLSSEEYDGTSWSYGGNLNTARESSSGFGDSNNGLIFGGSNGSAYSSSEQYDGSSFSYGDNLNNARKNFGAFGTTSDGLCAAGNDLFNFLSSAETYSDITFSESFSLIQYNKINWMFETSKSYETSIFNFNSISQKNIQKYPILTTQYLLNNFSSIINYKQILNITQNQSIESKLNLIFDFALIQNQLLYTLYLPQYNLLNRDIIYFKIIKSLDFPIAYAEFKLQDEVNFDLFEWIKIQYRSIINNSLETLFLGFITEFTRDLNQEITINVIKAKSPEWLLANQFINETYANTSKDKNPSEYIKIILGNESNWYKETAIYPYNISYVPNYSQDYQFKWSPIYTTKLEAIKEIEKKYSMKYLSDYDNISNIPRVRAYFIHNNSLGALLDHKTFDMNNDSTIFTIYKTQDLQNYKNKVNIWGYNTSLQRLKSQVIYSNLSYPLQITYESYYLQNQSEVNEYANTLYSAYITTKERYEAISRLRSDLKVGQTLNISNLTGHSNETFTIYYLEHNFSRGIGETRFKYAKIENQAFIEANKDLTIIDIIKNTAKTVIQTEKDNFIPLLATITSLNNQIATIRIENSSTLIENVHILNKNASSNDKVLYYKYLNCAI